MDERLPRVWMEPHASKKGYILMFEHICREENPVTYSLPGSIWAVMLFEPLTVMPSISCSHCGIHGWFKDAKWVSAHG